MSIVRIDKDDFFNAVSNFDYVQFNQSPAWIKSRIKNGKKYEFFASDDRGYKIILAGEVFKIPLIGKVILVDGGPLFQEPLTYQSLMPFLEEIANRFDYTEINSAVKSSPEFEVEIRRAGYLRPLWGRRCPMTIDVYIEETKINNLWKRSIKKAINCGLSNAKFISQPTIEDCSSFLTMFSEMKAVKKIGHAPSISELDELLSDPSMKLFVIDDAEGILAGRIIWVHKDRAYDVYAANSNRARNCGASYKLMHDIFNLLKNEGIKKFDFGRVGPGKTSLDSVFSFKRGSGGELISYNGEWIHSKSLIKSIGVVFYLALLKKQRRW